MKKLKCLSSVNENVETTGLQKKPTVSKVRSTKVSNVSSPNESKFLKSQADFYNANARYADMGTVVNQVLMELAKLFGFLADIEPSRRVEIGLCVLAIFILEHTDTKSSRPTDTARVYLSYQDVQVVGQPITYEQICKIIKNVSEFHGFDDLSLREICEFCANDLYLYLKDIRKPSKYWRTKGQRKFGKKVSRDAQKSLFHASLTECDLLKKNHPEIWEFLQEDLIDSQKK